MDSSSSSSSSPETNKNRHSRDVFDTYRMHGNEIINNNVEDTFRKDFRINSMNMKDGNTGEMLWSQDYSEEDLWQEEMAINLPASILDCTTVSREISFTSAQQLSHFKLQQHILLNNVLIEEWNFAFGFLIEGSTNSWQQTIVSAPGVMDAKTLSGHLVIETSFFDGEDLITKTKMRVYYV